MKLCRYGKNGFEKSAFWPCDKFPDPILRPVGDAAATQKIEVIFAKDKQLQSFELLWWGP